MCRSHRPLSSAVFLAIPLFFVPIVSAAATDGAKDPLKITYIGNAGWQIEDGKVTILVDPYLSEFKAQGTDNPPDHRG